jgi:death-on-curing protein
LRDLIHLTRAQVLEVHAAVLAAHGGSQGLRDEALLESAIAAPQATYGGESVFADEIEIAAAYLFYLCRNHPFVDGNKRVALTACLVFARLNGMTPAPDGPAWEALVLDVAASRIDRDATTARLRKLMPTGKRIPKRRR